MEDSVLGEAAEEIDAEALVKQIEETGSAEMPEREDEAEQTPAEAAAQMFKYKALGKEIEEPIDTILQRASMGYDYAQKISEFKKTQAEFAEQQRRIQEMEQKWKPFDDYARQNPEWYEHWTNAWQNRSNPVQDQTQGAEGVGQLPPEVLKEIEENRKFRTQWEEQQKQLAVQREDAELEQAIKSVNEKYSDIDFTATDPQSGKSLQQQIIDHAVTRGINNYEAAFKDFYHDQLVQRAIERAKEDVAKTTQAQRKQGIIGQSPTPFAKEPSDFDVKSRSWDQLERLAAKDLGIDI